MPDIKPKKSEGKLIRHFTPQDYQSSLPINIQLVEDRIRLGAKSVDLPEWVEQEIRSSNLVTGNGEMVSFCGLITKEKDDIWLFIPRGALNPENQGSKLKLAALVTNCIERYARQSKTNINANSAEEGFQGNSQICVIRELLEDYRTNGLYVTSYRQSTINQGKTNWKRTIRKITPYPDSDGMPVYPVLLGDRRNYSLDSIVTAIHATVIYRLDKMFGWWITGDAAGRVARELEETHGLHERNKYCLAMLRKERTMVFSDRNLHLISNLIKYFENNTDRKTSNVVIGLRDFHWAWEHMLGEVLQFRTRLNQDLPTPVYYHKGGKLDVNSTMRTDIILEKEMDKRAIVVDAKYYAATCGGNAPGWADLVKQFFYAKALKIIRSDYHIRNVFVFPGADGPLTHAAIESRDGLNTYDDEFPPIHCVYASPSDVMRHYLAGTKFKKSSDLMQAVLGD